MDQIGGGVGLVVGRALVNVLRSLGPSALAAAAAVTPSTLGRDPYESDPAGRDRAFGDDFAAAAAAAAAQSQALTNFYAEQSFGAGTGFYAVPSGRRHDWWFPPIAPWQDVSPTRKPGQLIGQGDLGEMLPAIGRNVRQTIGHIGDNDLVDADPRLMGLTGVSPSGRRAGLIGSDGAFPPRVVPVREIEVSITPLVFGTRGAVQVKRRVVTQKPRRGSKERKETGLRQSSRINQFITATYGRMTEWMDLYEAIRGNLVTEDGRSAAIVYRGRDSEMLAAWARGELTLDLPGAVIDFGVSQASDYIVGQLGNHQQRVLNAMGWNKPIGIEAYSSPVRWMAREAEHDWENMDEDQQNGLRLQNQLLRSLSPVVWASHEARAWLRRAWYGEE